MTYWLDLFAGVTWNEFSNAGSKVTGFRETRWKTIQRIKEGDIFLCYLTGVSQFFVLLEITVKPFQDDSPVWKDMVFHVACQLNLCWNSIQSMGFQSMTYGTAFHAFLSRMQPMFGLGPFEDHRQSGRNQMGKPNA
ncbi:hypothetical protein [Prosthecochloris sp.]|uniref:hypothetical protein n=1 Tax=Prosthecochloris sp. TaxID=290513 RepID=UPI00257C8D20|nr:hypothetical protein [Prosthecochloris sp.]